MAYVATFINVLNQFGHKNAELILVDGAGVLPTVRQWMKFPSNVTQQQMTDAAEQFKTDTLVTLAEAEFEQIINAAES